MEIFELRYFLAVAQLENVNRAAEQIHVSAGSLSKAISRLEAELQVPLFFRTGRGISLTPEGQALKKRAAQIIQLEEDARLEISGQEVGGHLITVSSEEILQTSFGIALGKTIKGLYPQAGLQFLNRTENKAVEQVLDGEVHLALITQDPPKNVVSKILSPVEFKTCASRDHALFKKFRPGQTIPVAEILEYPFVSPYSSILGRIAKASSFDGWRDDKFPRQIKYRVDGLKLLEKMIEEGLALGYLPDYFIKSSPLIPLKISGCPYSCQQTVRVIAKNPYELGWLGRLWDRL